MVRNNRKLSTRRNVIRGTLAGLGITALPAFVSTTRASDDDFVLQDGELKYTGSSGARTADAGPSALEQAVAGLNTAADRGLVSYHRQDDEVYVRPTRKNEYAVSTQAGCAGKTGYKNRWTWQGLRHIFHFDNCTTNEIRNKLIVGAGVAEMAALVAGATGNAPAAVVSGMAGILMGTSAALLDMNNNGRGVMFYFHGPNLVDLDVFEIEAQ